MSDPKRDIEQALVKIRASVARAHRHPEHAAALAHQAVEAWNAALPELAAMRKAQVQAAKAAGVNVVDLAVTMGMSRQRVYQIAEDGPTRRGQRPRDRVKQPQEEQAT
jgi:hypothetical protein